MLILGCGFGVLDSALFSEERVNSESLSPYVLLVPETRGPGDLFLRN